MRRLPMRSMGALVACSLLLAGCGAGISSSASRSSNASIAKGLFQDLTPLERTILSTTPIPFSQYELAVQASVSCLRQQGFEVSSPELSANGLLQFSSSYSFGHANDPNYRPTSKEDKRVVRENAMCQNDSAAVQAAYVYEHQSTIQQIEVGYGKMVHCYQSIGVTISSGSKMSGIGNLTTLVNSAIQNNRISAQQSSVCEELFQSVDIQPLPGISNLLRGLAKNS